MWLSLSRENKEEEDAHEFDWHKALLVTLLLAALGLAASPRATVQEKKPNIIVIMGDDVGWFNIGAYHQGIVRARRPTSTSWPRRACGSPITTPRQAARRDANFISDELPIRTGMKTVGQAGAEVGIPAQAVTLATVLKSMGYETGQFGKNPSG